MRTPFRFALPNWFGDPGPELAPRRAAPVPLWRRAARKAQPATAPAAAMRAASSRSWPSSRP